MEGTLPYHQPKTPSFFYSPETGVYSSKHSPRDLPTDPFQDLVSFLFSRDHQGTTALVDSSSGFSISYRELRSMVQSVASGLQRAGVLRNQVVLILLPNTVLYPVVALGALSAGAVVTAMNPLSSREEVKKSTEGCDLATVFTTLDNVAKVDAFGARIVPVPENIKFDTARFSLFDRILSSDPQQFVKPRVRQSDAAAILHSSGTSGFSKGVILTHRNLIASAELFVRFEASQYKEKSWENVYLAALPMFHVYGLSLFVTGLLSLGSMIVVIRRFDVEGAVRAMGKYKVTHFPTVPPVLGLLGEAAREIGCDLGSLRQVSCGAAPLSRKLIHDFLKMFPRVDFVQVYRKSFFWVFFVLLFYVLAFI